MSLYGSFHKLSFFFHTMKYIFELNEHKNRSNIKGFEPFVTLLPFILKNDSFCQWEINLMQIYRLR